QVFIVYDTITPFTSPTTGAKSFINATSGAVDANAKYISIANSTSLIDFINLNGTTALTGDTHGGFFTSGKVANGTLVSSRIFSIPTNANIGLMFQFTTTGTTLPSATTTATSAVTSGIPTVADFFSVGYKGDGLTNDQRVNNGIYRFELEETGDNTGVFTGTNQFVMLNQLNILDPNTYSTLRTINHDVKFVAIQDMLQAEARAPQSTFLDLGQDGVATQISAQVDVPTHTGVISFDSKKYLEGDTVTISLNDADLNVDNDLVDIYTVVDTAGDLAQDTVGKAGLGSLSDGKAFGRLVDVQFGQQNFRWQKDSCPGQDGTSNNGLASTGFSLVETGPSTGIFEGTFQIPDKVCINPDQLVNSQGQNVKVNYVDFRDISGKLVEISDNAGVIGTTGSIKLDKAVYSVPFGQLSDFGGTNSKTSPTGRSIFPFHRDVIPSTGIQSNQVVSNGDLIIHVRVFDEELAGDPLATGVADDHHGPIQIAISRQGITSILAYAGGPAPLPGVIITNETLGTDL